MSDKAVIACPQCGKRFILTPDMFGRKAGKMTRCSQCNEPIQLPSSWEELAQVVPAARSSVRKSAEPAPAEATFVCPHCNKQSYSLTEQYIQQYKGQEIACEGCGKELAIPDSLDPPQLDQRESSAGPMIPDYDSQPTPGKKARRFWREEKFIVMDREARLPDVCFTCGKPSSGEHVNLTVAIPAKRRTAGGGLGGAAIQLAAGYKATISIGFCKWHQQRRTIFLAATTGCFIAVLAFLVCGFIFFSHQILLIAVGGLLLFLAFFFGVVALGTVQPASINDDVVKLIGAHPDLLKKIPARRLERQAVQSAETAAFDQIQ